MTRSYLWCRTNVLISQFCWFITFYYLALRLYFVISGTTINNDIIRYCVKFCFITEVHQYCDFFYRYWAGSGGPVILTGRKGTFHSPGFPNSYPNHLNISWRISVPRGFLVKLQIIDMTITGETGKCKEDKLVISDAYATLGQLS